MNEYMCVCSNQYTAARTHVSHTNSFITEK